MLSLAKKKKEYKMYERFLQNTHARCRCTHVVQRHMTTLVIKEGFPAASIFTPGEVARGVLLSYQQRLLLCG